ncbi:aminotransferase class I/II-fold pyridoxal phosphate-dependent enzyme [Clostridium tyrobutyricum]|uniref:pyridoxal phosphate-dependent aminotransferase n=1 Tax=Clostridium tyrobutyricum TaxID=1519 RepID=UPI001C385971|nr:aminotransferase class I/II-fold pyridoxal phosphate-dependent enzyme [Clostridium tyrobutyricum]
MEHGGDIYTEGILKGRNLLDFSSNINPLGVPKSFRDNIDKALNVSNIYPDEEYRNLKHNIRNYLHKGIIENENIVLGNGAAEVIDLVIKNSKSICIVVPSFIEYEKNALKWNCNIIYSKLKGNMDFDYEDIESKLKFSNAVIVGNPNNPNGNILDKKKFMKIVKYCNKNGKTIIIDEAFIEFTGNEQYSFLNELENYKCIFIVRALTKFFGLPGIRFGYGISTNKYLIQNIKTNQNPWNINCFAETAVKYVLKDGEYIHKSLKWISDERKFMKSQLNKISIINKIYNTYANFILCKLKSIDCMTLYDECMKNGAIIRKCNNYRGLDNNYIRLAIKDREKNQQMLDILSRISINYS